MTTTSMHPSPLSDAELVRMAYSELFSNGLPVIWQEELIKRLENRLGDSIAPRNQNVYKR